MGEFMKVSKLVRAAVPCQTFNAYRPVGTTIKLGETNGQPKLATLQVLSGVAMERNSLDDCWYRIQAAYKSKSVSQGAANKDLRQSA